MTDQIQISLDDLRFYAYHGVMPQERVVGGDYSVSLLLEVDGAAEAVLADRLEATVDYGAVARTVALQMAEPSGLLEHVAGRVARAVVSRFRRVARAEVTVRKLNPPIGLQCGGAAVTLQAVRAAAPRLLVLDFDGTVADTAAGIVRTMREAFRRHALPLPDEAAVRRTIGLPLEESVGLLADLSDGPLRAAVTATYREIFEEIGAPATRLFPDVRQTLCRAAGRGVTVALATSRGCLSADRLCAALGIGDFISLCVGCEDVRAPKPAPEAVERILSATGAAPSGTLVVGDTSYDIQMGRAAGCRTCGVTYGNHSAAQLTAAGADTLALSFADILQWLA